jgi:hypothetical protein
VEIPSPAADREALPDSPNGTTVSYPHSGYPHDGYPQQPPPKKKRHTALRILLAIVFVIIAGFVACTARVGKAVNDAQKPRTITYQLDGKGTVTVTYTRTGGGLSQQANVKLPFTADVSANGFSVEILTGTLDQKGGDITCRILDQDKKVIAETKSSGAFASCSASTPLPGTSPVGSTPPS